MMRFLLLTTLFVVLSSSVGCAASSVFAFDDTSTSSTSSSPSDEAYWKQVKLNVEHEMHQTIIDNALNFALEANRELQSGNTPEQICDNFQNATEGIFTCECERFGAKETQVDCTYVEPQCSTDLTTCYTGTISQILSEMRMAKVVTTCTTFTTSDDPAQTCIRVFPVNDGRFRQIDSCSATYSISGEEDDARTCSKCSVCDFNNATKLAEISIDCCNIKDDLKQTCGPVGNTSGAAIPRFDIIPPAEVGMCTSRATSRLSLWGPAVVLSAATVVLSTLL